MVVKVFSINIGPLGLFVGWDPRSVAPATFIWYGDGFQFRRLSADWSWSPKGRIREWEEYANVKHYGHRPEEIGGAVSGD